jgi:hypothetical protein
MFEWKSGDRKSQHLMSQILSWDLEQLIYGQTSINRYGGRHG